MKKRISLLISFIFISSLLYSQTSSTTLAKYDSISKKIVYNALSERTGYKWLKELCEIGPRLSGSENYKIATDWALKKFESLGLDTFYTQECMVPFWERGAIEEAILLDDKGEVKKLAITALGRSIGTDGEPLVAKVELFESFEDLESRPEDAEGKIVFFNNKFDNTLIDGFGGYGKGVQFRVHGASRAAKYGAVAALIRSVSSADDNVPHTGTLFYQDTVKKIPSAALGVQDANFLEKLIKAQNDLSISLNLSCKNNPETLSWNIIGEIRGSEKPEEIVLVGGHFDSWDVGHGAHDDGGPCIQTMEVLKILNALKIKPKRTIRCVLFANEENGLKGALKYAEVVDSLKEIHYAAIESDRGVFSPRGFSTDTDSLSLNKMQEWLPILNNSLIEWIRKGGTGADISQIKNVKARFGYVPDLSRYMDLHHSANDVFEAVHPKEMELGSAAITILALLLSDIGL